MKYSYSYLINIQYLGFRFHGWQKQKNAMSLLEMIEKTLSFVIETKDFKSIGMGRTDAKVSANSYYFQILINKELNTTNFITLFNKNSPQDIKATNCQAINPCFNIIQSKKIKEYHYYFSNLGKNHPFVAPFMAGFQDLDIEKMKIGAKCFEGTHYYTKYCTKPSDKTIFKRTITSCEIVENNYLSGNFFPSKSYVLKVKGEGFLRYQIRLMMGVLIELGKNNIQLEEIKESLSKENNGEPLKNIAPGSGLQLFSVQFLDLENYLL